MTQIHRHIEVHGHDVMQMMIESGRSYTRETLRDAIIEKFGADARFHTCSAQCMNADEIIDLLASKGKFVQTDTGFTTDPMKICKH